MKLLSEKKKWSKTFRELRFKLKTVKQQLLKGETNLIEIKMKFKSRIRELKKQITSKDNLLNLFMLDDNDFVVDPKTGVIDLTQPRTPQKPKRKHFMVRQISCKKQLKL